jgi:hypothetical protein
MNKLIIIGIFMGIFFVGCSHKNIKPQYNHDYSKSQNAQKQLNKEIKSY